MSLCLLPLVALVALVALQPAQAAPQPTQASTQPTQASPQPTDAASIQPTHVPADDPRITIIGRSVVQDGVARFDWPGVRISFRMKGAGFGLRLGRTGPDFNVLVDGHPWTKLGTWGAEGYDLWLPDAGTHDVTLIRRQGPVFGATHFGGLDLPPGAELLPPPAPAARRIEFVGDSLTVGYGVEARWSGCEELRPFENAARAYASLAADALGAEPWIVAASGHGLVRNFGDPAARSKRPLPALYPGALFSEPAVPWTPPRPMDAVVVFLGTNDVSTEPAVAPAQLVEGYRALLGRIRSLHGEAAPLFLLSDESRPRVTAAARATQSEERAQGRSGVHLVILPAPGDDLGCDAHPAAQSQQRWADALAETIGATLGWPLSPGRRSAL